MQPSRTISIAIARAPRDVYDYVREPRNLPQWSSSFCSSVSVHGDQVSVQTNVGTMQLRFVAANELGVLDHYVRLPSGRELLNPVRVVANGEGSELLFTLFQSEGMTEQDFEEDAGLVYRDLATLKTLLEAS